MIRPKDERVQRLAGEFIAYLNDRYPMNTEVVLSVAPDEYACLDTGDDEYGFGVYSPDSLPREIAVISPEGWKLVLADEDLRLDDRDYEWLFLTTIAHEFRHHMQYCCGVEFSEEDATAFAEKVVKDYYDGV